MSAEEVFRDLLAAGVSLSPELGGRIRWRGPAGAMSPERRKAFREHKPALLEILRREAEGTGGNERGGRNAVGEALLSIPPAATARQPAGAGSGSPEKDPATPPADSSAELLALAESAGFPKIDLFGWGPVRAGEAAWQDFSRRLDGDRAWIAHATATLRLVLAGEPVPRRWLGPPRVPTREEVLCAAADEERRRLMLAASRKGIA